MKKHAIVMMVVMLMTNIGIGADEPAPAVQLHRAGEKELDAAAKAVIARWGMNFLKSANFNTANLLKQSVATIQDHYRREVGGDYVVITYDRPVTVMTAGGEVTVVEIVAGLNRPPSLNRPDEFASGLFTIDPEGRVVVHEKYAGLLPKELRKGPAAAAKP
jgi:hypothetical protein